MKKILLPIVVFLLVLSCTSTSIETAQNSSGTSESEYTSTRCFEVLIKKAESDSLTYDKPLNWDLVDFRIRNDEYSSLGTAFAINEKELVTAAHVMSLYDNSLSTPKRYVRERIKNGNETVEKIYEVDEIKAFNNHKDYVVFTVKDKVFDQWFETEKDFQLNSKVITAGDAYGEGIVTREGVLLNTIPENENGEWDYLKSSVAVNPGNSGGPLLNEDLKVIGVVLSKKEDFCYSLPIGEISSESVIHNKYVYKFLTFNDSFTDDFDYSIKTPCDYRSFMIEYEKAIHNEYAENMNKLFDQNSEMLFPYGTGSLNALYGANTSRYPQLFFENNNNKLWDITDYKYNKTDISGNGKIIGTDFYDDSREWFINIIKPDDVSLEDLYKSPKLQMDLILQGNNVTRKLAENDPGSRIISYGEPYKTLEHVDSYKRKWKINIWYAEYNDLAIINLTTPTPTGLSTIYSACYTYQIESTLLDLKKTTDYVNISYFGDLKQWKEFLNLKEYLFYPLSDYSVSYTEKGFLDFATDSFSIHTKPDFFNIGDQNEITLLFDIYPQDGGYTWGIRKCLIEEDDDSNNYLTFYRWNKPVEGLQKSFQEEWDKYIFGKFHPYDSTPYNDEGETKMGSIYEDEKALSLSQDPYAYSLFISREESVSDEVIQEDFKNYVSSIEFYK